MVQQNISSFVHIPKQKRRKFDRKAIKSYLVGYCGSKDGYRIWIPEKNDVIVLSRDVVFKNELPLINKTSTLMTSVNIENNKDCTSKYENNLEEKALNKV